MLIYFFHLLSSVFRLLFLLMGNGKTIHAELIEFNSLQQNSQSTRRTMTSIGDDDDDDDKNIKILSLVVVVLLLLLIINVRGYFLGFVRIVCSKMMLMMTIMMMMMLITKTYH